MIKKAESPIPGHVRITFELPASMWADHIFLTGDFNNWGQYDLPMRQERDGVWRTSLDLRVGQFYEFRYVVDGNWQTDYHADGFSSNKHGSYNSIVNASLAIPQHERRHRAKRVPQSTLKHVSTTGRASKQQQALQPTPLPHFRPRTPAQSVA